MFVDILYLKSYYYLYIMLALFTRFKKLCTSSLVKSSNILFGLLLPFAWYKNSLVHPYSRCIRLIFEYNVRLIEKERLQVFYIEEEYEDSNIKNVIAIMIKIWNIKLQKRKNLLQILIKPLEMKISYDLKATNDDLSSRRKKERNKIPKLKVSLITRTISNLRNNM